MFKVTSNGSIEYHNHNHNWGVYSDSRSDDNMAVTTMYYKSHVISIGYRYLYVVIGRFRCARG
jgi:hypothetical protein